MTARLVRHKQGSTIMNSVLLNYYEAIEKASQDMLEAARVGNWDHVVKLEGACAVLIAVGLTSLAWAAPFGSLAAIADSHPFRGYKDRGHTLSVGFLKAPAGAAALKEPDAAQGRVSRRSTRGPERMTPSKAAALNLPKDFSKYLK